MNISMPCASARLGLRAVMFSCVGVGAGLGGFIQSAARAQPCAMQVGAIAPDFVQANRAFGSTFAISGNTLVAGSTRYLFRSGDTQALATVFRFEGGQWVQEDFLTAPIDVSLALQSVAMSNDTIAVGFPLTRAPDNFLSLTGEARIYRQSNGAWEQEALLRASDAQSGADFGIDVAVAGDLAVVGADGADAPGQTDAGAAYIFERSQGVWTQRAILHAPDARANRGFGTRVLISGDRIFVSDTRSASAAVKGDAVYSFRRADGDWIFEDRITASDSLKDDLFGASLAAHGDTLVVGAPADVVVNGMMIGSAYAYTFNGTRWALRARLHAPVGERSVKFGQSLAAGPGFIAAADPAASITGFGPGAGVVHIFTLPGDFWTHQFKLSGENLAAADAFGQVLRLAGNTLYAAAPATSANSLERVGSLHEFALQLPTIGDVSGEAVVAPGATATLSILAQGAGELSYRWLHDGVEVRDGAGGASSGGAVVQGSRDSILILSGAAASDAGEYRCIVTGACGGAESPLTTLSVRCPADLDGTGFVDTDDFDAFIRAFESGAALADIDATGFIDTDDFDAFVRAYEQGC